MSIDSLRNIKFNVSCFVLCVVFRLDDEFNYGCSNMLYSMFPIYILMYVTFVI